MSLQRFPHKRHQTEMEPLHLCRHGGRCRAWIGRKERVSLEVDRALFNEMEWDEESVLLFSLSSFLLSGSSVSYSEEEENERDLRSEENVRKMWNPLFTSLISPVLLESSWIRISELQEPWRYAHTASPALCRLCWPTWHLDLSSSAQTRDSSSYYQTASEPI